MRKLIILIFVIVHSLLSIGQQQTSVWYFGNNAGVDFKSGSPVALLDGALATREGCATFCDRKGDILFYTEGTKVWNKDHEIMENGTGLLGDFSSTQSAVIIPWPEHDNLFYIITVSTVYGGQDGILRYSIVDLSFNSGLGKVTVKNELLYTPVTEKVTAVKKANGMDFWVIAHECYSNTFLVYSLTESGLDKDNPLEINVGTVHEAPYSNFVGYLKASPTGKYLACALHGPLSLFELFSFDNKTGMISNPIVFNGFLGAYGLEFSPDETRLYLGRIRNQAEIFQANLALENPDDIVNSLVSIGTSPSYEIGALQIGPDKRIYVSLDFSNYLGVINQPNSLGNECDFQLEGVYLEGRLGRLGLPNFVTNLIDVDFAYQPDCFGDSTWFTIQYSGSVDSVKWDFGDPLSGTENQSTEINPFHQFSSPGTFAAKLYVFVDGLEYLIEKEIEIFSYPFVDLGNDTSLCSQSGILLEAGGGFNSYQWQDGSTDSVYFATLSGEYWVRVENECGASTDTILIDFSSSFDIDLGKDTSFCYGQNVLLSPGSNYYSYLWQNGSMDSVFYAGLTGTYWVIVTDSLGCTAADSVYIEAFLDFGFSLGPDTSVVCEGDYLFLHGPDGFSSYEWQDGSAYPDFIADTAGIYWLEVYSENGCAARDSMQLIVNSSPANFLDSDTIICEGGFYDIHAPSGYTNYIWQDGATDSIYRAYEPGIYWVYVEDSIGCGGVDSLQLSAFQPPTLNVSSDTLICQGDSILLSPGGGMSYYQWNTGQVDSVILVSDEGIYSVEMGTGCGIFFDSVYLEHYINADFDLGPDTSLCRGESITLHAGTGFESYYWNDGSSDSVLLVSNDGYYTVSVFDGNCILNDSVLVDWCNSLWIPNVFTPNNDGYNDFFFAEGENIYNFEMIIFNRWGKEMAVLSDINQKWDGKNNGILCSDGVYYYVVKFNEIGEGLVSLERVMKGSVTLFAGK